MPSVKSPKSLMRRSLSQNQRPVYTTGKYQQYRRKRRRQTIVLLALLAVLTALAIVVWGLVQIVPPVSQAINRTFTVSGEEKLRRSEAFSHKMVHDFPHLANDSLLYFGTPNYTFETWARKHNRQPRLLPAVLGQQDRVLKQKLEAMLATYPADFKPHLFFYYPEDRSFVDLDAYSAVPAASVIKLPVLLAYFHSLDRDVIQWESPLLYLEFHKADGAGGLQYGPTGVLFPSREMARQMIQVSDNTATNILISYLGGLDYVNEFLGGLGLRQTVIRNRLPDLSGTNTISMYEMAVILNNIDSGLLLSRQSRAHALEILKGTHNWRLLAAPLPRRKLDFAHKTGDIGRALADVGIVYLPDGRKYIVAMQVDRPFNNYTARDMIQEASQIIYNHVQESKPIPEQPTSIVEAVTEASGNTAQAQAAQPDAPKKQAEDAAEYMPVDSKPGRLW